MLKFVARDTSNLIRPLLLLTFMTHTYANLVLIYFYEQFISIFYSFELFHIGQLNLLVSKR